MAFHTSPRDNQKDNTHELEQKLLSIREMRRGRMEALAHSVKSFSYITLTTKNGYKMPRYFPPEAKVHYFLYSFGTGSHMP